MTFKWNQPILTVVSNFQRKTTSKYFIFNFEYSILEFYITTLGKPLRKCIVLTWRIYMDMQTNMNGICWIIGEDIVWKEYLELHWLFYSRNKRASSDISICCTFLEFNYRNPFSILLWKITKNICVIGIKGKIWTRHYSFHCCVRPRRYYVKHSCFESTNKAYSQKLLCAKMLI